MSLLTNNITYSDEEVRFIKQYLSESSLKFSRDHLREMIDAAYSFNEHRVRRFVNLILKLEYLNKDVELALRLCRERKRLYDSTLLILIESLLYGYDKQIKELCHVYDTASEYVEFITSVPYQLIAVAKFHDVTIDEAIVIFHGLNIYPHRLGDDRDIFYHAETKTHLTAEDICNITQPTSIGMSYSPKSFVRDQLHISTLYFIELYMLMQQGYRFSEVLDKRGWQDSMTINQNMSEIILMVNSDLTQPEIQRYHERFNTESPMGKRKFSNIVMAIRNTKTH